MQLVSLISIPLAIAAACSGVGRVRSRRFGALALCLIMLTGAAFACQSIVRQGTGAGAAAALIPAVSAWLLGLSAAVMAVAAVVAGVLGLHRPVADAAAPPRPRPPRRRGWDVKLFGTLSVAALVLSAFA